MKASHTPWYRANPIAYKALYTVNNAIRRGTLKKQPCRECGSSFRLRCQHQDLASPLEVTWICAKCHGELVAKENAARPKSHRVCSLEECDRRHFSRGLCKLHYDRFKRHGDPRKSLFVMSPRGAPKAWIESHLDYSGDGCLIWPFGRHPDGRAQGVSRPTRLMCELINGPAPSPIHEAAHNCGNGHLACIHPRHLRWATPKENNQDKVIHGTLLFGSRLPQAKLTEADVSEIRSLAGTMLQREIAVKFGVTLTCINKIINRKSWRRAA